MAAGFLGSCFVAADGKGIGAGVRESAWLLRGVTDSGAGATMGSVAWASTTPPPTRFERESLSAAVAAAA